MSIEKIVVVEDHESLNHQLSYYLRDKKYTVASTTTLAETRKYLAQDSFDFVLADLRLPDGTCLELLKELQERPQRPVVVIMTGEQAVEPAVECMRHGAFHYFVKPLSFDELEAVLARAGELNHLRHVTKYYSKHIGDDQDGEILGRSPAIE
jgi:DNA-binding NtrC family response regulator